MIEWAMVYYYEDVLGRVVRIWENNGRLHGFTWNYITRDWELSRSINVDSVMTYCIKIDPKESIHPAFVKIRFYEDLLKEG